MHPASVHLLEDCCTTCKGSRQIWQGHTKRNAEPDPLPTVPGYFMESLFSLLCRLVRVSLPYLYAAPDCDVRTLSWHSIRSWHGGMDAMNLHCLLGKLSMTRTASGEGARERDGVHLCIGICILRAELNWYLLYGTGGRIFYFNVWFSYSRNGLV